MQKKNIANIPEKTSSITPLAVASERSLNRSRRTSGACERRSIATKAASSAPATAIRPRVEAEPQPQSIDLTIA